jgi:hypothetical protein
MNSWQAKCREWHCLSFHTFSLPEHRCVQMLVKNLDKHMPKSTIQEELEALNIHVQGVTQL